MKEELAHREGELREEIAQALQGKITAKEALDATVKYCNERL